MPGRIKRVSHPPKLARKTQVAAYARVSSGKDSMLHSLSAQVSYYSNLIQARDDWEYAGVYADEAVTGTKESRNDFQRMLTDCRAGKIDRILTKSISRFARNTVTLLTTVRELKTLGVDIFFEEQNIHTMSADGELMLTILASYAQEESRSVSENQKWRIRKNFEEGKPWNGTILGYRFKDGQYAVVPEEANIVRTIFSLYLDGNGANRIVKELNADALSPRFGCHWYPASVMKILKNYAYTGNLLLQKTYRESHLASRVFANHGELPKYHATETHEAIIPVDLFEAVQTEIARRTQKHVHPIAKETPHLFTGLLSCSICGKHYRHKVTKIKHESLTTERTQRLERDKELRLFTEALRAQPLVLDVWDERLWITLVEKGTVHPDGGIAFEFKDGTVIEVGSEV